MNNSPLIRRTPLKRTGKGLRRTGFKRKPYTWRRKSTHDWKSMKEVTWKRAGGRCERCGAKLPMSVPPAHLKPRSAGGSDRPGNLALLCLWGSLCHAYLDSNRAEVAKTETWLQKRMERSHEVREYFERIVGKHDYMNLMKEMSVSRAALRGAR